MKTATSQFIRTPVLNANWGHCACDCIVVEFTTTYAISAYHHLSCEWEPCSWRGVLDTTLCDQVCMSRETGWYWWFSPGTQVSSTNKTDCHDITDCHDKTDCHDITEILLKVTLNTITLTCTLNVN